METPTKVAVSMVFTWNSMDIAVKIWDKHLCWKWEISHGFAL